MVYKGDENKFEIVLALMSKILFKETKYIVEIKKKWL